MHHLDLAAEQVDLAAEARHLLRQAVDGGPHGLHSLGDLTRGGLRALLHLGRQRAEAHLGPPLDRGDLLIKLAGPLRKLGDGLVQAAEPARRRFHALMQLAHALLQLGQPLVLRPQRLHGLADGVAHRLQLRPGLLDVLRDGADVGPQRVQFGHRRDLRPEQLDVPGEGLGPLRRPLRGLVKVLGQAVQPGRHAGNLPLAHLLHQPLQPFHPLADVFKHVGVRPLVGDVVLYRAGEQLAHAIGGARLVSAKQDVVARLVHDAPSEGVAHPGAVQIGPDQGSGTGDRTTLVALRNQVCTESERV